MSNYILGNLLAGNPWRFFLDNIIFFTLIILCVGTIITVLAVLEISMKKATEQNKETEGKNPPDDEKKKEKSKAKPTKAEAKPSAPIAPVESVKESEPEKAELTQEEAKKEEPKAPVLPIEPEEVKEPETTAEPTESECIDAPVEEEAVEESTVEDEVVSEPEEVEEIEESDSPEEEAVTTTDDTEEVVEEPAEEVAEPLAEEAEEAQSNEPGRYNGKWVLTQLDVQTESGELKDRAFFFQLKASNGEALLTSEDYSTARGAFIGIETFKNNIQANNFRIFPTRKGKFTVKLMNGQGFLLARGENYPTRYAAMNAIGSIRRFAATAVRSNDVQHSILTYNEAPMPEKKIDESKKGKWLLRSIRNEETGEISYFFELHASNGQVLLTGEEYSSVNGAKNGINTYKNNIAAGNIRAAITRNGDYVLKVYTADGKLLALGEHYAMHNLCLSAIESVKRFAASAEIVTEQA